MLTQEEKYILETVATDLNKIVAAGRSYARELDMLMGNLDAHMKLLERVAKGGNAPAMGEAYDNDGWNH